jgi:hypothetical protein
MFEDDLANFCVQAGRQQRHRRHRQPEKHRKARADKIQRRHSFTSFSTKEKLLAEGLSQQLAVFSAVYILAKQHGVKNPESFGLLLAQHFINKVTDCCL